MGFTWNEYIAVAKNLLSSAGTTPHAEANIRAAVSRAYYAAFCNARNHLRDKEKGHAQKELRRHEYVIGKYEYDIGNIARRDIGRDLRRLKNRREEADYEDTLSKDFQKNAQVQIIMAQDVIKRLINL